MEKIEAIVPAAIDYHLGNIANLPESVQDKIRSVYKSFYSTYLNIAKLKGFTEITAVDDLIKLDSELIEYMRHFFSDYQTVYRDFLYLNRQVRELMQIDQQHYPEKFRERLDNLMAGNNDEGSELILKAILNSTP